MAMDGQDDQNCNFKFNLQQSLFVPGMKHILDNLTGDLLAGWSTLSLSKILHLALT